VLEGSPDAAVKSPQLGTIEPGRRTERVEAGAPQCLVGVDVSHARKGALVEQRRLQRRAAAGKTLAQPSGREERVQRLVAHAGGEVRIRLPRLEQEPGSEAADVPVRDIRSVV
jgi:hypothetical protein